MRLLARWLPAAGHIMKDIDYQFIFTRAQKLGYIKIKRHAPADMRTGRPPIDPHPRLVIHRPKMQPHMLALHRRRHFKHPPIPAYAS